MGITKRKKIFLWVVGALIFVVASPFLFIFGVMSFYTIKERIQRIPFDSVTWKANPDCGSDAKRIRMIDDLLAKRDLKGMSRVEVEGLLGESNTEGYFKDYDMVYCLGPERGFVAIDSEWLVIRLDHDKVVYYRTARD
ncbi:MAG: hypothetical protein ACJ71N_08635 [Terriglobales bacterium]|jgi:hypothetical protein